MKIHQLMGVKRRAIVHLPQLQAKVNQPQLQVVEIYLPQLQLQVKVHQPQLQVVEVHLPKLQQLRVEVQLLQLLVMCRMKMESTLQLMNMQIKIAAIMSKILM